MKANLQIRLLGMAAAAMLVAGCGGMGATGLGPNSARVSLSGAEQNPPVTTSASGSGSFSVNSDRVISGSVTTTGVNGTVAHIHTGAKGSNGPVTIPLVKTGDNVWSVPPNTKLTDAQYEAFKSGGLYVNVHSAQHKPGEIRAQIRP
jgi:hypothetical protein